MVPLFKRKGTIFLTVEEIETILTNQSHIGVIDDARYGNVYLVNVQDPKQCVRVNVYQSTIIRERTKK